MGVQPLIVPRELLYDSAQTLKPDVTADVVV